MFATLAKAQQGAGNTTAAPPSDLNAAQAVAFTAEQIGPGIAVALVLFFILMVALFSASETALISVRKSRVEQLVEENQRGAKAVSRLASDPPRVLATVQTGITLWGYAAAASGATALALPVVGLFLKAGATPILATVGAVALTTFLTALVALTLGEIAPKALASQSPDKWALRLAPLVSVCAALFAPFTGLMLGFANLLVRPFGAKAAFATPFITREEFEHIIGQGEEHGELDDAEAQILTNVFDLSETSVRAVMTPRPDMTALPVNADLQRALDTILSSGHSRIPVYEESIDNIVGMVHAKDLLRLLRDGRTDVELKSVMRMPHFVPEAKRVRDLLEELRRSNQQIAIVQDEYAGTAGIVTIEDVLEEIVGDIRDEYDVDEPDVQVLSSTESLVDGRMGITDVNDRLGIELPNDEYDTIGGLVFGLLGHEPAVGEYIAQDGVEFWVERVEGRRIRSLRAVKVGATASVASPNSDKDEE
jgi:CBS domain containing-hemolysin-like protein